MKRVNQLKKWITKNLKKITPGQTAVSGASKALFWGSSILFVLFSILGIKVVSDWKFIFFILGFVLMILIITYLGLWIFKKLYQIPRSYILAIIITTPLLFVSLAGEWIYCVFAVLILSTLGAGIAILYKGNFKNLTKAKKIVTSIGLLTGIVGIIVAILGFIPNGFEMKPIVNAAWLSKEDISPLTVKSPALRGGYKVKTLTYGSGQDKYRPEFGEEVTLKTGQINGVPFLDNWKGFGGWYREKYWGFNARELPINGYVWYPEGEGPFPLALIVHGNHSMQDFSDTGYAYLGELMASRGIIFASVDENFLNSSWSDIFGGLEEENDARGWVLLEHLKVWHEWNKDSQNIFFNKIDTTRLALLGHSRGGEAVAHAALLNTMPLYFDDASIPMNYNYNIKSIVAIAPVDGQYEPGNAQTLLKDINYLVLHGAQDGDVSSFSGSKQYERIIFSDSTDYFKSGLYIQGANHGQFNTSWGINDIGLISTRFLNNTPLLAKEDQEKIAKVYISAFLETTLKDNKNYRPLFIDARKGKDWLPETIYLNQYEDSSFIPLATFDEDFNVSTANDSTTSISAKNLSVWREQEIKLKWGKKGSRAAYIGWHYDDLEKQEIIPDSIVASYTLELKKPLITIDSTSVLTFSLAESDENTNPKSEGKWVKGLKNENKDDDIAEKNDSSEESDEDAPKQPIEFTMLLQDSKGNKINFCLSDFSALQREIGVRIFKAQFIIDETLSEKVFQTYIFPFKKMKTDHPNFDFEQLQNIQFIFDKTSEGVIVLDNLGFMKTH